jgi:3-oxoacyl-[acyl-carrier-protein] synthase-1
MPPPANRPPPFAPVFINALGALCALGGTVSEIRDALCAAVLPAAPTRLTPCADWLTDGTCTYVGRVPQNTALPAIPTALRHHANRSNQLLLAAFEQIRHEANAALAQYGRERVAVILGTSTSGMREGELAYQQHRDHGAFPARYRYSRQELGNPALFLAEHLGVSGPAYVISTACSSSARAIISACRLLAADVVDAAIVGGVDELSRVTLNGFHSLSALSHKLCRPFSAHRDGINIGEGAALFLLTRTPAAVAIIGTGESSDAHHTSAPQPDGRGAEAAMRMALASAALTAPVADIGYINLHGTATPLNDSMESRAVHRIFGDAVPCSSTKHLTGHTLAACGVIEGTLCHLLLENARALPLPPQHLAPDDHDPALAPIGLLRAAAHLTVPRILSNSFGFGGNNASLIFATHPHLTHPHHQ